MGKPPLVRPSNSDASNAPSIADSDRFFVYLIITLVGSNHRLILFKDLPGNLDDAAKRRFREELRSVLLVCSSADLPLAQALQPDRLMLHPPLDLDPVREGVEDPPIAHNSKLAFVGLQSVLVLRECPSRDSSPAPPYCAYCGK